jgi:hypothetical protein
MGAKKKAAAAGTGAVGAAKAAKDNPYVQRIVEDDELRDNLQAAYESARDAYGRLSSSKKPAKALIDDKKLQRDLKSALDSIRDAGEALREAPKRSSKKKGGGFFRKLLLAGVAGGLALALSEDLRKKVLDALFGAEEEFEYTSTTTASGGGATGGATTTSTAGATS